MGFPNVMEVDGRSLDHCGHPKSMRFNHRPIQWVNLCGSWKSLQTLYTLKPRHKQNHSKNLDPATFMKHFLHLVSTATPPNRSPGLPFRWENLPVFLLQGVIDSTTRTSVANVGPRCGGGAVHGAHDAGVARSRQSPGGRRGKSYTS